MHNIKNKKVETRMFTIDIQVITNVDIFKSESSLFLKFQKIIASFVFNVIKNRTTLSDFHLIIELYSDETLPHPDVL